MDIPPILGPAAVLVLWSLVVLLWMTSTRFPAFAKAGINLANTARGARYADVEKNMPEKLMLRRWWLLPMKSVGGTSAGDDSYAA